MELAKTSDEKSGRLKQRVKVVAGVALVSLVSCGCAGVRVSSSPSTKNTAPTSATTTEAPTTTTTTTLPPDAPNSSGKFLGAMEILRNASNEVNTFDAQVTHRLNNGLVNTTNGITSVDPNSMLAYGFVYYQNTAPFGTIGGTSVVAGHDVTHINANIYLNGHNYIQPEVTEFTQTPGGPPTNEYEVEVGDEFIIYLNLPGNEEKVLTYEVEQQPYTIPQTNIAEFEAIADPPANLSISQLADYTCYPPGTKDDWLITDADLISTKIMSGNGSYFGTEPPIHNPSEDN
jgi:hypothetical protein